MTRTTSDERWLSVGEAGRVLGMSRTTLLAAEDAGLIAAMRTPGGHRRYRPAELRRYLAAAGAGASMDHGPAEAEPARDPAQDIAALDMATAVRAAVGPLVRALDADSGGLYLARDGALRFCAAAGIPRWLTERLAEGPAPPAVAGALDARGPRHFDPASAAFPEARSTGHGVALPLTGATGVLFVVTPHTHELVPAELRVLEAFAEMMAVVVEDRSRITELSCRLARIGLLTDFLR